MDPFRNGAAGVVSSAKLFRPEDFVELTTITASRPPPRGGEYSTFSLRVQNMYFSANCMMRGSSEILNTPKLELVISVLTQFAQVPSIWGPMGVLFGAIRGRKLLVTL